MFTDTRPVKCNVQIINGRKSPAKGFDIVIVKFPKTHIIIPLWPLYYMPQTQKIHEFKLHKNITINSEV